MKSGAASSAQTIRHRRGIHLLRGRFNISQDAVAVFGRQVPSPAYHGMELKAAAAHDNAA
ncbi:hypothetical protein ACQP1G_27635 [Nocardia sp. CA-107356]|uniref:hypothetical protein n=1 Tax=Nocardia sp. CA-107356 TaxID=3239972 RepID=UPI003D90A7C2